MLKVIKASELEVGDTIAQMGHEGWSWSTCIVKNVTEEYVELFRPYGTTADFSHSGGVICYIGFEEYKILRNSTNVEYILYRRQELK